MAGRSKRSRTSMVSEAKAYVAKVKIINGPEADQQPILHHLIYTTDEKEARRIAEDFFLKEHKEMEHGLEKGETLRGIMEAPSGSFGDILDEIRDAWDEIMITPLKDWLSIMREGWVNLNE